jgi:hypothetical protein
MCDYSLHSIKNRPATAGDELFVNLFHSGSKGLASVADFKAIQTVKPSPERAGIFARLIHRVREANRVAFGEECYFMTAVCLQPGARLRLSGIPKPMREEFGLGEVEEVMFTQLPVEECSYHDAFLFGNGEELLIQHFPEGLRVQVLALDLEETAVTAISYKQSFGRSQRANA